MNKLKFYENILKHFYLRVDRNILMYLNIFLAL